MEKRIKLKISGSIAHPNEPHYDEFYRTLGVEVSEEEEALLRLIKFRRSVYMTISMEECRALKDELESFLWKDQDDLCQISFKNGYQIEVNLEGTGVNGEVETLELA